MIHPRDTDPSPFPNSATLTYIGGVNGFDYHLVYRTNSYQDADFSGVDAEVRLEESNSKDFVDVLFREEDYDAVAETVSRHLETDLQY